MENEGIWVVAAIFGVIFLALVWAFFFLISGNPCESESKKRNCADREDWKYD